MKRIVLGLDGSHGSQVATEWCAGLAKATGAQVVAVYAVTPSQPVMPSRDELEAALANDWCQPLQHEGVDTRTLVIQAEPAGALLSVADDCDADVIVVGRRGADGFDEFLLGSVPSQLALYSKRPILIVPEKS